MRCHTAITARIHEDLEASNPSIINRPPIFHSRVRGIMTCCYAYVSGAEAALILPDDLSLCVGQIATRMSGAKDPRTADDI